MPDHVHFLASFPPDGRMEDVVARWKRYTSTHAKIRWQRDFFDHRLRSDESFGEKADYILENPVRAGLIDHFEKWPFVLLPE
jgi:putative transposase